MEEVEMREVDSDKSENTDNTLVVLQQEYVSKKDLFVAIFAASIGHFLEWFDFAIFGLLATSMGTNFFPNNDKTLQTMATFAVFAGAFFVRPIGGILYGHIGDKYGRITALRLSLYMMAIPTFLTAISPKYNQIGIIASILLIIFRLMQGLSVGGEMGGAVTYIVEICPPQQKAVFNAMVHIAAGLGTVSASLFIGLLHTFFTQKEIDSFIWRIPFILGSFVGLFGIWLRKALKQSTDFIEQKQRGLILRNPVYTSCITEKFNMFTIVCHLTFMASIGYTMFVWLPSYMLNKDINPIKQMFLINGINLGIDLLSHIISSIIIDKYFKSDPIYMLIIFGVLLIIYLPLIFPFLATMNTVQILFVQMIFAMLNGMYHGGITLFAILRLKNISTRYSSFAVSFNIAFALFGGTAPFLATLLMSKFSVSGIGVLLAVYGIISITTDIILYCYDSKQQTAENVVARYEGASTDQENFNLLISKCITIARC